MQIINCEFHVKHDKNSLAQFKIAAMIEIHNARKDRGNQSFALYEDIENPYELQMIEAWESEDAIEQHASSEHNLEFNRVLTDLVTRQPAVHQYNAEL